MADSPSLQPRSLGKTAVPTPGTPVRVTSDTTIRAHRNRFAVAIGETGRVFLGVAGMNKASGAGVVKEFWPTGAGGGVADELVLGIRCRRVAAIGLLRGCQHRWRGVDRCLLGLGPELQ